MVGAGVRAIISVVDKVSGPLKKINRALRQPIKAIKDLGAASAGLGQSISASLAPLAGIGTALALGVATIGGAGVVKTSMQFEKFQTVLETVEGSSEKAKASMDWVANFAKTTPYQLEEVNAAFVQLRAYGLDPTNGLLRTLGDASAGMGKQIGDAVEMIADAARGENERLKEFGIVGEKSGNELVYHWDYNGKQMVTKAKNNSKDIQKALSGIFDKKFGGAMDKLSRTADGLWSNIQDSVTAIYRQIGDSGAFDELKFELQNVLNLLNGWSDDGTIASVAQTISDVMVDAVWDLWAALAAIDWVGVWADIQSFGAAILSAVDAIGGWQNALIAVAIILNAQTIMAVFGMVGAVVNLGVALWGLSVKMYAAVIPALASMVGALSAAIASTWAWTVALLANPIGLVIAAVVALAGAAYLIYDNWAAVSEWFGSLWASIKVVFGDAVDFVVALLTGDIGGAFEALKRLGEDYVQFILTLFQPVIGLMRGIGEFLGLVTDTPAIEVSQQVQGAAVTAVAGHPPDLYADYAGGDGLTGRQVQQAQVLTYGTVPRSDAGGDGMVNRRDGSTRGPSPVLAAAAVGQAPPVQGEIKVTFENTPPGTRVQSGGTNQPGLGLNPDVGYRRFGVI